MGAIAVETSLVPLPQRFLVYAFNLSTTVSTAEEMWPRCHRLRRS
jgi:hypothetical protein